MKTRLSRRAFTLVEVLVVIATIAVLAAILLPVIVQAKHRAQVATSLQQLGQIQLATQIYAGDHNDRLPYAVGNNCFHLAFSHQKDCGETPAAIVSGLQPINMVLRGYLAQDTLFSSPVDRMSEVLLMEGGHASTWYQETATKLYPGASYEYNTAYALTERCLSSFQSPSEAVIMFSLFAVGDDTKGFRQVAFSDGHLKQISISQFGKLVNDID